VKEKKRKKPSSLEEGIYMVSPQAAHSEEFVYEAAHCVYPQVYPTEEKNEELEAMETEINWQNQRPRSRPRYMYMYMPGM